MPLTGTLSTQTDSMSSLTSYSSGFSQPEDNLTTQVTKIETLPMTMSTSLSATSLAVTIAHAVTYLTHPLATRLSHNSLSALQTSLEANLAATFALT